MNEIVEKLKEVELELSNEFGDFTIFGLFLREDATDRWDVVVAAPWVYENKPDSLKKISTKISQKLNPKELVSLSQVVIIDRDNPATEALHRAIHVKHGVMDIRDTNFFGLQIKQAFLITSQSIKEIEQGV